MQSKFVRAPNSPVLIVAGVVLLVLAALAFERAALNASHYRVPAIALSGSAITDAVLGIALLYVALSKSRFAGATAVVVSTFLIFGFVFRVATDLIFFSSVRVTWWTAIYLAIAGLIIAPSLFPWSSTANKSAFFWMGLTFATLTLLLGSVALLARL